MTNPISKCIHPLLSVSISLFVLLFVALCFVLPNGIRDAFRKGPAGPCTVPVLPLLLIPIGFMFLLGLGFSGIRVFVVLSERRKTKGKNE